MRAMSTGSRRLTRSDRAPGPEVDRRPGVLPILLTVDEAAELLRTSRRAIDAMIERRQLPGVIRIRRRVIGNGAANDGAGDLRAQLGQSAGQKQETETQLINHRPPGMLFVVMPAAGRGRETRTAIRERARRLAGASRAGDDAGFRRGGGGADVDGGRSAGAGPAAAPLAPTAGPH